MNAIVRLPYPRSSDGQGQKTFWAPSANKQTHNYGTRCSNQHPFISALWIKGLSPRKMKWWAIYRYKFSSKCHSRTTPSSERRQPGSGNVFSTLCWQENPKLWHKVLKPASLRMSTMFNGIEPYQDEMVSDYIYIYIYIYIYMYI